MKTLIRWCILNIYRKMLRPMLHAVCGPLAGCRFTPSCSEYFLQAVENHGVCKGCCLGIWRIMRCNPWGGCGSDPVPPVKGGTQEDALSDKDRCCSSRKNGESDSH